MRHYFIFTILLFSSIAFASANVDVIETIKREFNVSYEILIEDNPEVNAYTNGKYIVVYKGLLDLPEANYQSIGLVLMHEIGHIENQHIIKKTAAAQYTKQMIKDTCIQEDGNLDRFCVRGYYFSYLKYERSQEYEADDYAYRFAKEHKFNAEKACAIYKKFATEDPYLNDEYSTHPASVLRYRNCVDALNG
jgi:Zn-dependent protease with chaperone function